MQTTIGLMDCFYVVFKDCTRGHMIVRLGNKGYISNIKVNFRSSSSSSVDENQKNQKLG